MISLIDSKSDIMIFSLFVSLFSLIIGILFYMLKHMQNTNKELISTMRDSYEKQIYLMNDKLTASIDRWQDVNHLLLSSQNKQNNYFGNNKVYLSKFLKANGIKEKDLQTDNKLVFVLTPFNNRFSKSFDVIQDVCMSVGLKCMRGDEEFLRSDILPHILKLMCKSGVVIANIEGRNPNVFYELGLAHAFDKKTLLVSKTTENLPIDIKSKRIVVYSSLNDLSCQLKDELLKIAFDNSNNNYSEQDA
jgi:hypothetical protein